MKKLPFLLAVPFLPVAAYAQILNVIDGSGTVTSGGTSQQVFSANSNRSYLECQNPIAATEPLFVNIGANASTSSGSFGLAAGGSIRYSVGSVPLGTVNVTATTTGHAFVCKQG